YGFAVSHSFNAFAPECSEFLLIRFIIPCSAIIPAPFFVVAHHWFMVGGGYHNAVFICKPGIFRIVGSKNCGTPHGRPKVIPLIPQDQFIDFFIKFMIKSTELLFGPTPE